MTTIRWNVVFRWILLWNTLMLFLSSLTPSNNPFVVVVEADDGKRGRIVVNKKTRPSSAEEDEKQQYQQLEQKEYSQQLKDNEFVLNETITKEFSEYNTSFQNVVQSVEINSMKQFNHTTLFVESLQDTITSQQQNSNTSNASKEATITDLLQDTQQLFDSISNQTNLINNMIREINSIQLLQIAEQFMKTKRQLLQRQEQQTKLEQYYLRVAQLYKEEQEKQQEIYLREYQQLAELQQQVQEQLEQQQSNLTHQQEEKLALYNKLVDINSANDTDNNNASAIVSKKQLYSQYPVVNVQNITKYDEFIEQIMSMGRDELLSWILSTIGVESIRIKNETQLQKLSQTKAKDQVAVQKKLQQIQSLKLILQKQRDKTRHFKQELKNQKKQIKQKQQEKKRKLREKEKKKKLREKEKKKLQEKKKKQRLAKKKKLQEAKRKQKAKRQSQKAMLEKIQQHNQKQQLLLDKLIALQQIYTEILELEEEQQSLEMDEKALLESSSSSSNIASSSSSSVSSTNPEDNKCAKPLQVVEEIQQALLEYLQDGIGKTDHALKGIQSVSSIHYYDTEYYNHNGATILHSLTSETYRIYATSKKPNKQNNRHLSLGYYKQYMPEDWEKYYLPNGWEQWPIPYIPSYFYHTLGIQASSNTMTGSVGDGPMNFLVPSLVRKLFAASIDKNPKDDVIAAPEVILHANTVPGSCWPMKGTSGYITILLPYPIQVSAITIDHVSSLLVQAKHRTSAPKTVVVKGYPSLKGKKLKQQNVGLDFDSNLSPIHITKFQYDIHNPTSIQTFSVDGSGKSTVMNRLDRNNNNSMENDNDEEMDVPSCGTEPSSSAGGDGGSCDAAAYLDSLVAAKQEEEKEEEDNDDDMFYEDNDEDKKDKDVKKYNKNTWISAVRVEILDNWGNNDYTCLYRVRIHGEAAVA